MRQFLSDKDDVLLNFAGYLRVKRADFLRALGLFLSELLTAALSGRSRGP